jgi:hypothetical protein
MANGKTCGRLILALTLVIALAACASTPTPRIVPISLEQTPAWLSFLVDGKTTREELLLQLGVPSMQFEGERILTFLLTAEGANVRPCGARLYFEEQYESRLEPRLPIPNTWADYHLVIVFRPDNVVERHSLIAAGQVK